MVQLFTSIGLDKTKKSYTIKDICSHCHTYLNNYLNKTLNDLGFEDELVFHCTHDIESPIITYDVTHLLVARYFYKNPPCLTMSIRVLIANIMHCSLVLTPNIEILILTTSIKYDGSLPKYLKKLFVYSDNLGHHWHNSFVRIHILPRYTTHLNLNITKNQRIILSKYILHIKLVCASNSPIVLTKHVKEMRFECIFNHPIVLTKNLLHLSFNKSFNQPLRLNKKIKHLKLNYNWKHPIILTPNIQHLEINQECFRTHAHTNTPVIEHAVSNLCLFNLTINEQSYDHIPNGTKNIVFRTSFRTKDTFNNLPSGLKKFLNCGFIF